MKNLTIDPIFKEKINFLDFDPIKDSRDVIYIVDANFVLKAFNQAWIDFARNNNGQDVLVKYPIGSVILDGIHGAHKTSLEKAYRNALEKCLPFEYNYPCPTAKIDRVFHQIAYPLFDSIGLLINNHLLVEKPHSLEAHDFYQRLIDRTGFIRQCCYCRKIKDPNSESWLWVPSLVEKPFLQTSHGICPYCLAHYFPHGF